MTARLASIVTGGGLVQKVMRSTAIIVVGFGTTQALRLASNLILTRLLFPEAFGMMAIITVFLIGLTLLSDPGLNQAIMRSKRGDDPDFLDTAWTIQVVRGGVLWLGAAAIAWPLARLYEEPDLTSYLPVAALVLVINGLNPTRLQSAWRHLRFGQITGAEIASQIIGISVAVAMALWLQSVWALVISNLAAAIAYLVILRAILPGHRNRLQWDRSSGQELIRFGFWIFLSTLCGFATTQADKLMFGHYLSLADFGLYNIAFFLASFAMLLGGQVMGRMVIPVFRDHPPSASAQNYARLRRLRFIASAALSGMVAAVAFGGVWLVELLYDPRYHAAGGLVVVLACTQMPALIAQSCEQVALAGGDSRRFFWLTLARAVLVVGFIWAGLALGRVTYALVGQGIAHVVVYPVLVWLLRPHGAWDPLHDAVFAGVGIAIALGAITVNADAVAALAAMHPG